MERHTGGAKRTGQVVPAYLKENEDKMINLTSSLYVHGCVCLCVCVFVCVCENEPFCLPICVSALDILSSYLYLLYNRIKVLIEIDISACCCSGYLSYLPGPLLSPSLQSVVSFTYLISSLSFLLSGYRICLGSSTDKKDSGRLHVDFAQARDDLYEWECRQRMLAREERHRRKMEEDRLHPPSPPPIVHYSEHECSELGDKIKGDKLKKYTLSLFTEGLCNHCGQLNKNLENYPIIGQNLYNTTKICKAKKHFQQPQLLICK